MLWLKLLFVIYVFHCVKKLLSGNLSWNTLSCGGDDEEPEYNPPPAPKLKTAEEIFNESIGFAKGNYPLAYSARETALADIGRGTSYYEGFQDPQVVALLKQLGLGGTPATAYYESFQPTSFEQALGNQYFANVMPDIERSIKQNLSLSGMEYSPILSEQIAEQRGKIGVDIGSILANLGQTRATTGINTLQNLYGTAEQRAINSLNARMGIDPYNVSGPYANVTMGQSNQQAQLDYEASVARAQADYQNALAKSKEKQSKVTSLMMIGGAALGAVTGGLGAGLVAGGMSIGGGALLGAGIGAGTGAVASPLFGGGQSPISFSDALAMSQIPAQQKTQNLYQNWLAGNTPTTTTGTQVAGSVMPVNEGLPALSQYAQQKGLFGW